MAKGLKLAELSAFLLLLAGTFLAVRTPEPNWGLKVVSFDVGQADAALVLTHDGEAVIIDMGRTTGHGAAIADYLLSEAENGIGRIETVKFLFASHYDSDHIGGAKGLEDKGIKVEVAYDQGPSVKRKVTSNSVYGKYVRFVGDLNGDGRQDTNESAFVRKTASPGLSLDLMSGNATVLVLAVNGTTVGEGHNITGLVPADGEIDENPGSVALLVRFGEFEFLTAGDATSHDWKPEPDTEAQLLNAHAIPGGPDIDVLKVNHHGSDTSTGRRYASSTRPELAIISTRHTSNHRLPKLTAIKVLQEESEALILATGTATNAQGQFNQSSHEFDDGFTPSADRFMHGQGRITILVDREGQRYTVTTEKGFERTFSAVDP